MRVNRWVRMLGIAGAVALGTGRAGAQNAAREDFICTHGAVKRVISVFNGRTFNGDKPHPGSCHVDYTKDGKTLTVWSSKTDPGYCTAKAAVLITKLVRDNFSCKGPAPPAADTVAHAVPR